MDADSENKAPKINPIKYNEWVERYKPLKNSLDTNAAYDGCMYETYGKEYEEVTKAPPQTVWTLISDDEGEDCIVAGWHYVNRLGYFITEKSWDSGVELVLDD